MSKGKGQCGDSSQPPREMWRWTEEMDSLLVNAMVDEVRKGNRIDGSWSSEAYANMVKSLQASGLDHITKNHIKNRQKTMKDKWREVHDLFKNSSGFAWSPITKRFEAEDQVWDALIKAKPAAVKWKTMQVRQYDLLNELYASDRASGEQGLTARQIRQALDKNQETINLNDVCEDATMNDPVSANLDENQVSTPNVDSVSPTCAQSNHSTGTSGSRGTKRKTPMEDVIEAQMEKLTSGLDRVADAIISGNALTEKLSEVAERDVTVAERQILAIGKRNEIINEQVTVLKQTSSRVYSEADVWKMLTAMNVPGDLKLKCYEFLCNNDSKKRLLLGIPYQMRAEALVKMLTEAGLH